MPDTKGHERMVRLLLDAATADRERGRAGDAGTLLEEALQLSHVEQQRSWIAAVRASQGVLERTRGNLETAEAHLSEALAIRRELQDSLGVARALGDLGRVHLDAGRAEEARSCLDEAMGLVASFDAGRTRAELLEHGGLLHARLGDPERARACLKEALDVYERLGDGTGVARVQAQLLKQVPRQGETTLDEELRDHERARLIEALEGEGWNQSRAARRLGVTETRVRNLMHRHGLRSRNRRGRPRKRGEAADQTADS